MNEHEPWKVLIADDEEMILRLIQMLIPWEELNLRLAATASNGLEAMEYLKDNDVDILITDARMPACDGIELIKWCHEQQFDMKYIIISGYRDFEYAHGAIKYGVDSYLLKPINQEELTENLRTITDKLAGSRDYSKITKEMQQQMERDKDSLRRHFVRNYIYDGNAFPDRIIDSEAAVNEEFKTNFASGIYRAVTIKVDDSLGSGLNLDDVLLRVYDEASHGWNAEMTEIIGCVIPSGVMLILNYQPDQEKMVKQELEVLYERVVKMLDAFESIRIIIGVSSPGNYLASINKGMEDAVNAVKYRLYLPHVPVIYYENYSYDSIKSSEIWTSERSHLLENYMRTGNEKGIRKMLFDLKLEIHQDRNLDPVSIFDVADAVAGDAMKVFAEMIPETFGNYEIYPLFRKSLFSSKNIDEIADALESLILRCIEIMSIEMEQQESQPIRIIREFIDEHFAENISLNDVADRVQLSKNYVSTIFRKETGVNFQDLLTAKRTDEAARLLRRTNLSIAEIAEKVGYTDVKYFSKMFKKNLGMNPSEYRKLYL